MRTLTTLRTFLAAATVAALSAPAWAGGGRIVVMPFEGPQQLADDSRTTVVTEISRSHDVVAPTTWVKARRTADQHELGEKAWAQAAKRAKVDAIIEGKVVTRGGKATLAITVVDAHEGTDIDRVEITIGKNGVGRDDQQRVRDELLHMLEWVDGVSVTRAVGNDDLSEMDELQDLDASAAGEERDERHGRRGRDEDRRVDRRDRDDRDERASDDRDADDRDADDRDADDRDHDRGDRHAARDDRDTDADDRDADDRDADDRDADDRDADDRDADDHDADADEGKGKPKRGDALMALFGEDAATTPAESTRKARRAAKAATGVRMFEIDAGLVAVSRSFTFQGGPDAPLDYPGGITKAIALNASLYPMSRDPGGRYAGFGLTVDYARGLGSSVEVGDADVYADLPIIYQEWATAAHYRYNTPKVGIDGSLGYRSITHVLDADTAAADDFGPELDALDGEYGAITAGARVEFAASPRSTIGLSAQYLYVTSVGVITAADMLGSGQAWGARAQADFNLTLSKRAYLRAALTYERVGVEFSGDGDMDADWEVDSVADSFTGGQLGVGIKY